MSRREFLKQLSIVAVASACAFKGGSLLSSEKTAGGGKDENLDHYEFDAFKGCKSSGFKFSCPLPFDFKLLDDLVELNQKYKKSKMATLYGALPDNSNPLVGFTSSGRGTNDKVQNFKDFTQYVKYAKNHGFKFVYLLNSPKPFLMAEYNYYKPKLDVLLEQLKDIGVRNVKVANPQMLEVLKDRKDINIQASTSFECNNIRQLQNILDVYPRIKNVNLAIDSNRNIPFLKNVREIYKDVEFELMADESCIYGCPARIAHISCSDFVYPCQSFYNEKNKWKNLFRTNVVYPWNLDYYASIGFKNFKFMGFVYGMRPNTREVTFAKDYFEAVENGIEGFKLNQLFGSIGIFPLKEDAPVTKEMIAGFPNINYFIEHGDECATKCGAGCNYCFDCADKLNKTVTI